MGASIILNSRYFRVAQTGEQPKDKKILTKQKNSEKYLILSKKSANNIKKYTFFI